MSARIFRPAKSAMQSGLGRTKDWVLEFPASKSMAVEPLMGWTSNGDMSGQVRLLFATSEEAVAYAERQGLAYTLVEPKPRKPIVKSYSNNFKYGRIGHWTH